MKAHLHESSFLQTEIRYLGFVINQGGVLTHFNPDLPMIIPAESTRTAVVRSGIELDFNVSGSGIEAMNESLTQSRRSARTTTENLRWELLPSAPAAVGFRISSGYWSGSRLTSKHTSSE